MKAMGPSFTFAGRAFLSTDAAELGRVLRALRNVVQPMGPLAAHLERMDRALQSAPDDLKKEHIRLFLDPEGAPCPPWQSAYGSDPEMMGPSHRSALGWYRALGIEPKNPSEPADHIGLLLAFYGTLLDLDAALDIRAAYYEEHLAWMPAFLKSVEVEARHEFYRELAVAVLGLIAQVRPAQRSSGA